MASSSMNCWINPVLSGQSMHNKIQNSSSRVRRKRDSNGHPASFTSALLSAQVRFILTMVDWLSCCISRMCYVFPPTVGTSFNQLVAAVSWIHYSDNQKQWLREWLWVLLYVISKRNCAFVRRTCRQLH